MRDNIGNKIEKDTLVLWQIPEGVCTKLVFQVVDVSDGGIKLPNGGHTPPRLVLQIVLPLPPMVRADEEPQMPDFFVVPNPRAAEELENLMAGKKN